MVRRETSYGILLYKKKKEEEEVQYFLGKIPQGNYWTVFKGLPNGTSVDDNDETPHQTAMREFAEETGNTVEDVTNVFASRLKEKEARILTGKTSKKNLQIYLVNATDFANDESIKFHPEQVVKIDSGYMAGTPEIVATAWMTASQALRGFDGAKLYPSQHSILQHAATYIISTRDWNNGSSLSSSTASTPASASASAVGGDGDLSSRKKKQKSR